MKPWPPSTWTAFGATNSACSAASASAAALSHAPAAPPSSAAAARHTASLAAAAAVAGSTSRNASACGFEAARLHIAKLEAVFDYEDVLGLHHDDDIRPIRRNPRNGARNGPRGDFDFAIGVKDRHGAAARIGTHLANEIVEPTL